MNLRHWLLVLLFFVVGVSGVSAKELVIASWNIQHLGHGTKKNYQALGEVGARFDFIAVQEVMTVEGITAFKDSLEAVSGESWQLMHSHLVGRSTYKEMYAFVWRESAVEYLDGAVVYLDPGNLFAREPYSARFRDLKSGQEFAASTVHIVYGKRVAERVSELEELANYWQWLEEVYPETPVMLMGDFNMPPRHKGWGTLKSLGVMPLLTEEKGATTLSTHDGKFANLYDNIWIRTNSLLMGEVGILKFPLQLGLTHKEARSSVSDHAPVYMHLLNPKQGSRLAK